MSDPKTNPVLQLQYNVDQLYMRWHHCKDSLHDFRQHFLDWSYAHETRDKAKLTQLCGWIENNAPALCSQAQDVRTNLANVISSHPAAEAYSKLHKKYSKPKWLTFLADSKTHLDKFWKKYFEDLPDGQLVADVKATVKHCKEMTAAALSL